jgi:hypothetical protein
MEGDRELDHAERRSEVATGGRHGPHDRLADLDGQLRQLDLIEATEVGGVLDGLVDLLVNRRPVAAVGTG